MAAPHSAVLTCVPKATTAHAAAQRAPLTLTCWVMGRPGSAASGRSRSWRRKCWRGKQGVQGRGPSVRETTPSQVQIVQPAAKGGASCQRCDTSWVSFNFSTPLTT